MGDIAEAIAEEICNNMAEQTVQIVIDTAWSMCGNPGQQSIIGDCVDQYGDQVEGISNGDFEEVESDHPEAVGIITDTCNEICQQTAELCSQIRELAESLPF